MSDVEPQAHPEDLQLGDVFGHYRVLSRIGRSGMGDVYSALDLALGRKVALKVWQESPRAGRKRMLNEAQAMARLRHPNIAMVYEAGEAQGRLFLAMGLLDGGTARQWSAAKKRSWGQTLALYRRAGAGLSAAHQAGIIHRDFGPDSVVLGEEQVCVTNFGLARDVEADEPTQPAGSNALGYLAPERRRGRPADAASDQYSFCAALHEALAPAHCPRWLRRTLERGMADTPAERWPTMNALLAALDAGVRTRRRLVMALTVGVLLVGAGGVAALGRPPAPRCTTAPMHSAWGPAEKQRTRDAFLRLEAPLALDTWTAVERSLDAYAASLSAMEQQSCEATVVRRTQPAAAFELRAACLNRRRTELAVLLRVFASADDKVLRKAAEAAAGLTPVTPCSDAAALALSATLPDEAVARGRVLAARAQLSQVRALTAAGRTEQALEAAAAIEQEAKQLGFRPLVAEATYQLGFTKSHAGDVLGAESLLRAAALEATAAGLDALAANAWMELVPLLGSLNRTKEARELVPLATAAIQRLGGPREEEHSWLSAYEGKLDLMDEQPQKALPHLVAALAKAGGLDAPPSRFRASLLGDMAVVLQGLGRSGEAVTHALRRLAMLEELLGHFHPNVAHAHQQLANLYLQTGHPDAERELITTLDIYEKTVGGRGVGGSWALNNLAILYRRTGRFAEATALYNRSLQQMREALGANHLNVAMMLMNVAANDQDAGNPGAALANAQEALRIAEGAVEDDRPVLNQLRITYAEILRVQGDHRAAQALYRRALANAETRAGKESVLAGLALAGLGASELQAGRSAPALVHLTRGLELLKQRGVGTADLAETEFFLAQAQWAENADRSAAVQRGKVAFEQYTERNTHGPMTAPMRKWLEARRAL